MKMITKRGIFLWILSALFIAGMVVLIVSFVNNGSDWAMKRYNKHMYHNGELIGAGTIYDSNNVPLAQTVDGERVYNENRTIRKATMHIVGDKKNFISTGVQSVYDSRLTGYNLMFGVYNLKRYGKGNDLKLTIDSEICERAYNALDGRKGTVGVVNYKTGDIICCVSNPTFDVNNPPDDIDNDEDYAGVYINRLLSARYVPGSTFKIVTAICAIENMPDVFERTWDCDGGFQPDEGVEIKCNADHGHKVTFKKALAKSCNSVFAQIAIELGEEKLNATAKELGIGSAIKISGEIQTYPGKFTINKNTSDDKIGWTGIGQGDTRIAPIAMLRVVSAIANGGNAPSFNVVKSLASQAGEALNITLPSNQSQMMSPETASAIKGMLRYNVEEQYGDYNYDGLNLCAKSGTAQIDNDDDHNIAWFTGFMDDDSCPYAFVVAIENGNSGSRTAGPVANKVMQKVKDKYGK